MDTVDKLSQVTGLSRGAMEDIMRDVQANQCKLRSCPAHDFVLIQPSRPLKERYRCKHCGGEVDHHAYYWHEQGRKPRP